MEQNNCKRRQKDTFYASLQFLRAFGLYRSSEFMRLFLILMTLLAMGTSRGYCESPKPDNIISIDFEVVEKGWHHGADIKKYYPLAEVHTKEHWLALWKDITSGQMPPPVVPNIDFNNWFIVAVFDLEKPNGCYHFDITHLYQDASLPNSISYVSLDYGLPGLAATCLDAGTKNYEIVKVKRR